MGIKLSDGSVYKHAQDCDDVCHYNDQRTHAKKMEDAMRTFVSNMSCINGTTLTGDDLRVYNVQRDYHDYFIATTNRPEGKVTPHEVEWIAQGTGTQLVKQEKEGSTVALYYMLPEDVKKLDDGKE